MLGEIERERANVRAALVWLAGHEPGGRFLELADILGRYWYRAAVALYELGLGLLSRLDDEPFWTSAALRGLGTVEVMLGNIDRAEALFHEALSLERVFDGNWLITTALYGTAQVASARGHHAEAIAAFRESLAISWQMRDRLAVVATMPAVAEALVAAGEFERAARVFGATVAFTEVLSTEIGSVLALLACHVAANAIARARLGDAAYHEAWSIGHSLAATEVVQLVLASLDEAIASGLGNGSGPEVRASLPAGLSEREADVLRLTASDLSNAEAAERLYLSPHTVRAHLQRIYAKIEVDNRAEAVRFALENGIL